MSARSICLKLRQMQDELNSTLLRTSPSAIASQTGVAITSALAALSLLSAPALAHATIAKPTTSNLTAATTTRNPAEVSKSATSGQVPSRDIDSTSAESTAQIPSHLIHIPDLADEESYFGRHAFVADKSARTLEIWRTRNGSFERIASFPADMGKNDGDKQQRGDHKTPEGIYFLLDRLEGAGLDFSQYGSRAYTTDYPNLFDKLDRKTGDGIWLHAVPDNVPLTRGSRGCVVVRNEIVKTLDPYIRLNRTPIIISDKVEVRAARDQRQRADELRRWLDTWRDGWENSANSQKLDTYMSYYDETFKSLGMNKSEWREFKQRLSSENGKIEIRISEPMVLEHRGRAVLRFVQAYSSEKLSDLGEKTLHLLKRGDEWKVISETWMADNSPLARLAIEAAGRGEVQRTSTSQNGHRSASSAEVSATRN